MINVWAQKEIYTTYSTIYIFHGDSGANPLERLCCEEDVTAIGYNNAVSITTH